MKTRWQKFQSLLAATITRYLSSKRLMGCTFNTEERALRLFDRYLMDATVSTIVEITPERIEHFLASRPLTTATRYNNLLGVVRRLFDWMIDQQELRASPVQMRSRRETWRRLPFLYEPATIKLMLDLAAALPDFNRCRQRGFTYATILAMIAGLGLRISEASRLKYGDVDIRGGALLIRNSKFGKTRMVPFGPRFTARLQAYISLRQQRLGAPTPDDPFFTWNGRTAVHTNSIRNIFRDEILPQLHLHVPPGTRGPCVHGLRHTFAVKTLLRWYREGVDPNARLNHLSTFLGHTNPQNTAVYLTITSELLQAANQRFEAFAQPVFAEVRS